MKLEEVKIGKCYYLVYYKYKRGFINEPLYNYIIYKNSMSSGDDTEEKKIKRENEHLDIVSNTLKNMLI